MGLLSPQGCPDPAALMEAARQVASALGLQLPNVVGELLLLKCCKELNLPEVRNDAALEVFLHGKSSAVACAAAQALQESEPARGGGKSS